MIKIAIIEAGDFHDECLYSHIQYLKSNDIEITLFCNARLKPRIDDYQDIKEIIYLDMSNKVRKYKSWFKTWKHITKNGFSKIILNSAESNIYKLLKFPFPKRIEITGVIHNAQNLKNKGKQKAISRRIHKYLALNDFATNNILLERLTDNKVETFYPIFFPDYENEIRKPEDEIWITVPGAMDYNKRDYDAFNSSRIPEGTKIIFLGSCSSPQAKMFQKQVENGKQRSSFVFFESYINNQLFFDYIKNSDYILPLIHPKNESFQNFLKYKISGSFNLAFGYKKPLLMEQSFASIQDFQENAIFYNLDEFENLFQKLKTYPKEIYHNPKWDFKYQKQKYSNFILNE